MRKDSESLLRLVLDKRESLHSDELHLSLEDFASIPNINSNVKAIIEDLKHNNCITVDSNSFITGEVDIGLTQDGIEYFSNKKENANKSMDSNITTIICGDVSGSQIQQGSVNSCQTIQTEGDISYDQVEDVIKKIKEYDDVLDKEFGSSVGRVREIISAVEDLIKSKNNPTKLKQLLYELKTIAEGVVGGLIATGIVQLLTSLIR